jgi:NAD(P)-dependent dehydrogenase (short-subunit alcohol dehydrogenase family)
VAGYRRGLRLPGSVVAVTGAAGAVGGAVAAALAAAGARPVPIDRPGTGLDRAAARCGAPPVPVDLADDAAVRDAAQHVVDRCGRLDGWVHCSGAGVAGSLLDLPLEEVRRVLDVDLLGAVHGARAALPHMLAQRRGVLVVVVSLHGQVALPSSAPQGMAAAGVRVLAAALRQELRLDGARGVAVTAVLAPEPGPAGPPFLRGGPERVASTVVAQLRRPRLEKVAGGALTKAVVHGHALVPAATEWFVAGRTRDAGRPGIGKPW